MAYLNPHLSYTTFCLKSHIFKWGASATGADKFQFYQYCGIAIKNATSVRLVISLMKYFKSEKVLTTIFVFKICRNFVVIFSLHATTRQQ
jgi:hypothetical protein